MAYRAGCRWTTKPGSSSNTTGGRQAPVFLRRASNWINNRDKISCQPGFEQLASQGWMFTAESRVSLIKHPCSTHLSVYIGSFFATCRKITGVRIAWLTAARRHYLGAVECRSRNPRQWLSASPSKKTDARVFTCRGNSRNSEL